MFEPFERRASGIGIAERYRELAGEAGKRATARTIVAAAASGDDLARRVVEETTSLLAGGLVNMCAVPAPEVVVLGGGVAWAGEALVGPIRHGLGRSLPTPPRCVLSELGAQASGVGAVRLALGAAYREEFSFGLKRDYEGRSVQA